MNLITSAKNLNLEAINDFLIEKSEAPFTVEEINLLNAIGSSNDVLGLSNLIFRGAVHLAKRNLPDYTDPDLISKLFAEYDDMYDTHGAKSDQCLAAKKSLDKAKADYGVHLAIRLETMANGSFASKVLFLNESFQPIGFGSMKI